MCVALDLRGRHPLGALECTTNSMLKILAVVSLSGPVVLTAVAPARPRGARARPTPDAVPAPTPRRTRHHAPAPHDPSNERGEMREALP